MTDTTNMEPWKRDMFIHAVRMWDHLKENYGKTIGWNEDHALAASYALASELERHSRPRNLERPAAPFDWTTKEIQYHADLAYNLAAVSHQLELDPEKVVTAYARATAKGFAPRFTTHTKEFETANFSSERGATVSGKDLLAEARRIMDKHHGYPKEILHR